MSVNKQQNTAVSPAMIPYEELTFKDGFAFRKVMCANPSICQDVLEMILQKPVRIATDLIAECDKKITPDGKGVRFDIYGENENEMYDVEIQTSIEENLPKRSRYYQDIMDVDSLKSGEEYESLRKSYVIFICTEDPFRRGEPVYTFRNKCEELDDLYLDDGTVKIFLNAKAANKATGTLADFLHYLANDGIVEVSKLDANHVVSRIDEGMVSLRSNEKWRVDYMTQGLAIHDAKMQGKIEGRIEGRASITYRYVEKRLLDPTDAAKELGCTVEELLADMQREGYAVPELA